MKSAAAMRKIAHEHNLNNAQGKAASVIQHCEQCAKAGLYSIDLRQRLEDEIVGLLMAYGYKVELIHKRTGACLCDWGCDSCYLYSDRHKVSWGDSP